MNNNLVDYCTNNGMNYLLSEWNYDKNTLQPELVSKASHKNVWWKCSQGHEWQATVKNRTSGTKCPICSRNKAAHSRNASLIIQRGSLLECCPELVCEWHPYKNVNINMNALLPKSNRMVWWKCKQGHEWKASPATRVKGSGCPYCSGRKPIVGENDLETSHPEIAKEWHSTKNGHLLARDFSYGSHKKVWWQCKKGHEWQTPIAYRTIDKTGCPLCAKELQTSFPEQAIFYYIKKCFPDAINNDRTVLDGKELDIFIPSRKIAIEYDGEAWHKKEGRDLEKDKLCHENGIRLIHIRESGCQSLEHDADVYDCVAGDRTMLSKIIKDICFEISNKILDINIERDALIILEQYIVSAKESSIANLYPDIAREWHPYKNGKLNATMFFSRSGKKVWWQCPKGHEWQAVIETRTKGIGCPYCSGRNAIPGENDLETINPTLAREWHPTRNGGLKPSEVLPNSGKKVWWRCAKGHEWQDTPSHRSAKRGCPYCSGRRVIIGETDLGTTHPELAKEWHQSKNGTLSPSDVSKGSNKSVWWQCAIGHEWRATINDRSSRHGCPYCSGQRVLDGFNDLATTHPELIDEWDFEKNTIIPSSVSKGSHAKVWWKCSEGHEWQAQIRNRINGTNCPFCSGKKKPVS